ncbi:MAG: alpha/beta hydrolase [Planctomycetota bacterium]
MAEVRLTSTAGALVARVDEPSGSVPTDGPVAAVVCHPHPLFGGTLENKVVHATAKALAAEGLIVLRFNFRGVAGSEGSHEGGPGEQDDARAALDLAQQLADSRAASRPDGAGGALIAAGYSFGAWAGLSVAAADPRVAGLLAIAPPVNFYDFAVVAATDKPLTVVYARDDEVVPAERLSAFLSGCARQPQVLATEGGGHMFHGRLGVVREAARAAVRSARTPDR